MGFHIAVCLKHVPLRSIVDPKSGTARPEPGSWGMSRADQAALEWALRMVDQWGATMTAVTIGQAGADALLKEALALGAETAVRIHPPSTDQYSSAKIGAVLAQATARADLVLCGNLSTDRGTGSVPAFLAASSGRAQALGLIDMKIDPEHRGTILATRRLDHGRRETLRLRAGSVLSVEGNIRLRRASLPAVLAAKSALIQTPPWPSLSTPTSLPLLASTRFRPPTRVLPPPRGSARERLRALTGANKPNEPAQVLELGPEAAAELVEQRLIEWGHWNPEGS